MQALPKMVIMLSLLGLTGCVQAQTQPDELSAYYGFGPMEVLKLDWEMSPPEVVDLNQDGRNDLLVVNNRRARIELLLQRANFDPQAVEPVEVDENVNDILGKERQWRFLRASYPVNVAVTAVQAVDLNGDGWVDLVYTHERGVTLVMQKKPGRTSASPREPLWQESEQIDLKGVRPSAWALAVGDLNGDQRPDIVVLRDRGFYLLMQGDDGQFKRPELIETSVAKLRWVGIEDLDGDGRQDLVLWSTESSETPVLVRLQQADGTLGPERHCAMPTPSALTLARWQSQGPADLLAVANRSGRLGVFTLASEAPEEPTFAVYPVPATDDGEARAFVAGDLNGDGLSDMIVTSPGQAQFVVLQGRAGQSLAPAKTYPGLKDMRKVCSCRLEGRERDSLVVLSVEEKLIAISHYQGERLSFPQTLPVSGRPVAMAVTDFNGDGRPDLIYVSRSDEDYSEDYTLYWQADMDPNREVSLALDSLDQKPADLLIGDIDHNGRSDVLIVQDYGPLILVRQDPNGALVPQGQEDIQAGLVSDLNPRGVSLAPLGANGQTALLAARGNFARALDFAAPDGWRVIDQYQLNDRSLRVNQATVVHGDRLVILDENEGRLFFMEPQDDGTYGLAYDLKIGSVQGRALLTGSFSDPQQEDLVVCSDRQLIMVQQRDGGLSLQQVAVFETEIKNGRLSRMAVDDMNHNGQPDIVVGEVDEHHVQILTFDDESHLQEAYTFKVFEQHRQQEQERFQGRRGDSGEPRALAIGDVTGDGKSDLILLVHDRLIVYPQD